MIWLDVEARLVLALVFTVSAASKLRSRAAFAAFTTAVGRLAGVPAAYRRPAAALLAAGEVLLAAGLLVPATAHLALALAAALLLAFTAALARALRAPEPVACNCFGPSDRPVSAAQLVRNGLLVALAASALAGGPGQAAGPADVGAGPLLVSLLGAVAAAGAVALWDDLAELFAAA
ncbi:MauE/DoxX family redox-associated membrane protein [Streptomyces sp. NPDC021020]|uniref:MauE/DoxX family redox-associated membrane protein n=1 Tax=Streptomyces sp. NPDC021020 TaxID=3365109 RepID=UPI00379587D9